VAGRDVGAPEAGVTVAERDIAAASAALGAAQARRAYSAIESPIDGFVVSRELEVGAAVNPGTPILKIADPLSTWVTVFVDERVSGPISLGDPADIALRSMPGHTFTGRVARIRRESDRVTEQTAVDITFDEAPARLTLGEQAEASIHPPMKRAVAIPVSAVVRTPEGAGAWTVVEGRLRFRPLRIGLVDPAGWIEVVEGVAVDERVVLAPGKLADPSNEGRAVLAVGRNDSGDAGETP
jgi:HlyD family secretion protein